MVHDNAHDPQLADAPSAGCTTLPAETIYHILRFLDPQDLIRLQAVSKLFQAIIRDPAIWRTVYATARLPLPPGPFAWQSTHFLQRTLVHSARLARTWTTEPLTLISSKVCTGPRSTSDDGFRWVRGRWLIVSKDMRQLRARDVGTGAERVLWDDGAFANWATTSVVVPRGHLLYVVVHLGRGRLADPVKLLEFVADDDTGNLTGPEAFDVPTGSLPREAFIPRIRIDSGLAPYTYISLDAASKPRQSLIFDPRSRQFYKFPRFRTQLDLLVNYRGAWLPHLVEVHFTQTHLFVLSRSYLIHGFLGEVEVIQTFAFPDAEPVPEPSSNPGPNGDSAPDGIVDGDDARPTVRELRLTHETLTRDTRSTWLAPIRPATVDPITKSTTLRFMHTYAPFYPAPDMRVRVVCTDYHLPAGASEPRPAATAATERDDDDGGLVNTRLNAIVRSTEPVLPITLASHDVFSVPGQWRGNLVDASPDGFIRGLCMVDAGAGTGAGTGSGDGPTRDRIHKFTVDASGARCVAVVGDPSPLSAGLEASRHYEYAMDGMRGRIWYTKLDASEQNSSGELVDRDVLAIVVDFK